MSDSGGLLVGDVVKGLVLCFSSFSVSCFSLCDVWLCCV